MHHDLWDYDVPAQPTLFELEVGGRRVAALAQITKMGHLFLLDRETGEPLYPVEERPVPQGGVPGETLSPTQPFPTHPAPLHPAKLAPEDAFGFTPWDRGKCAEKIRGLRYDGIFTPPSLEGSLLYPSNAGGPNWGGVSIDPVRGRLFVNQMRLAGYVQLHPARRVRRAAEQAGDLPRGALPHGGHALRGAPWAADVAARRALQLRRPGACSRPSTSAPGKVLWEVRLGTTRDQAPFPMWLPLGAPNLGGSLATASGLVFIGATTEKVLRAFDADSGEEIWSARLPYTANATPMSYRLRPDGRQYVVVAAGGHGWSEPGDAVMAFALPD